MQPSTKLQLLRGCLVVIITILSFSVAYSQSPDKEKEIAVAIDNVNNGNFKNAIPVLQKYTDAKGLNDLTTLQINVYLNWCYLNTKKETLNIDKVNKLTDSYYDKYGISETDTIRSSEELTLLYFAGKINKNAGNTRQMIHYLTLINEYYKKENNSPDPSYLNALFMLANGYYDIEDYRSAIQLGKETWEVNMKLNVKYNNTSLIILDLLAASSENIDEYANAIEYLELRAQIGKEILGVNNDDYLFSLNLLGEDYYFIGEYEKAMEIFSEVVELYRATYGKKNENYLVGLNNKVATDIKLGKYKEAFDVMPDLIELTKEVLGENDPIYLKRLRSYAEVSNYIGDYQKALETYLKVVELRKEVLGEKNPDYIKSLADLAMSYSEYGDYLKALEIKLKVVELYKEVLGEKNKDYLLALANLGVAYSTIGDYKHSLEIKLRVVDLGKEILGEKDPGYLLNLNNLALSYSDLGDDKMALETSQKVIELGKKVFSENDPAYLTCKSNLALIYMRLGDYEKAYDISLSVWEIRKEVLGERHPDYLQSMSIIERLHYGMGDFETSYDACRFNVKWTKEILGENHPFYLVRLNNLSLTEFQLMKYDSALNHSLEMINILRRIAIENISMMNEIQREQYWGTNSGYFNPLPLFLENTMNKSPEAVCDVYNAALFRKGLLLNTTIDFNNLITEKGTPEAIAKYEELKILKLEIQRLIEKPTVERYLNVDSLENIAQQKETELVKLSKEYGDYTSNLKITWEDVQEKLNNNDVAIEFVEYPTLTDTVKYAALVIRKGWQYPRMIPLFRKDQIEEYIKQDKDKIYSNGYVGKQIRKLMWEPLEEVISPGDRVYFSPAGIIYQLALENLLADDSITLGERYRIYRLSSTKELVNQHSEPVLQSIALYGGLKYDTEMKDMEAESKKYQKQDEFIAMRGYLDDTTVRSGWKYLNGTLNEADQISRVMRAKKYDVNEYTGIAGNEESFKALSGKKTGIIHIATHGFFLPIDESRQNRFVQMRMGDDQRTERLPDPMLRSGLMLAGGNRAWRGDSIPDDIEDGVLTAREISQLDLRGTDLVVLSACETGLGEVSGEGVFGLQRGFKQAGVKAIIMSLWSVKDEATQYLMTNFYTFLAQGDEKRVAFQKARNLCRSKYPDPASWAAFIMLD